MAITFSMLVDTYMDKCCYGIDAREKRARRKVFDALSNLAEDAGLSDFEKRSVQEEFNGIVDEYISRIKTGKPEQAARYNDFVDFAVDKSVCPYNVRGLARIDRNHALSNLERRLDIVREYAPASGVRKTQEQLAEKYWVSADTIAKDFDAIRKGELNVFGQNFSLDEPVGDGRNLSTAVPVVLACNIEQIIAMLDGLYIEEKKGFNEYAKVAAAGIWGQLSEYVRGRVIACSRNLSEAPEEWFEELGGRGAGDIRAFIPERDFTQVSNQVMEFYKCGQTCNIKYVDGGRLCSMENVTEKLFFGENRENYIIVQENGQKIFVDDIVKIEKV